MKDKEILKALETAQTFRKAAEFARNHHRGQVEKELSNMECLIKDVRKGLKSKKAETVHLDPPGIGFYGSFTSTANHLDASLREHDREQDKLYAINSIFKRKKGK